MKRVDTNIKDLFIYERVNHIDERGSFERLYCKDTLDEFGIEEPITQINRSHSKAKGTLRGLHLQKPPHSEIKIITCIAGSVYDVAVDLRAESPTFKKYFGVELDAQKKQTIVIPKGFAHGFQTLTENCELLYLHTSNYSLESEFGISPFDSSLAISWSLPATDMSSKDKNLPQLSKDFSGIEL